MAITITITNAIVVDGVDVVDCVHAGIVVGRPAADTVIIHINVYEIGLGLILPLRLLQVLVLVLGLQLLLMLLNHVLVVVQGQLLVLLLLLLHLYLLLLLHLLLLLLLLLWDGVALVRVIPEIHGHSNTLVASARVSGGSLETHEVQPLLAKR